MGSVYYFLVYSVYIKSHSKHTSLVRDLACLLDTGGDVADQLGLLAVAGEVGQLRAAIGSQSRDEAVELYRGIVLVNIVLI